MPESSSTDALTRLASLLGSVVIGGGGLLGWAKLRLAREKQFVELGLMEAQTEEHKANAHKITVDSLIEAARERKADLERAVKDTERLRERAETAEARIEQLLEEQKERHRMANELHAFTIRWALLEAGVSFNEVKARRIEPIYPDAEID